MEALATRRQRRVAAQIEHRRVRACGPCDACCTRLGVPGVTSEGVQCEHRAAGGGCDIYDDRPLGCRAYACLWIVSGLSGLPIIADDERPDLLGVIATAPAMLGRRWHVRLVEVRPGALAEAPALRLRARLRVAGWVVHPVTYHQRGRS